MSDLCLVIRLRPKHESTTQTVVDIKTTEEIVHNEQTQDAPIRDLPCPEDEAMILGRILQRLPVGMSISRVKPTIPFVSTKKKMDDKWVVVSPHEPCKYVFATADEARTFMYEQADAFQNQEHFEHKGGGSSRTPNSVTVQVRHEHSLPLETHKWEMMREQ